MRSILRSLALLTLTSITSACVNSDPEPSTVVVRDSAGVRIVEHAPHATPQQVWRIDLDGATEFATPEGDTPLYRVSNALRLDDGRIIVADAGNNRLLAFAPDGSLLSKFGRQGDGPGEFRNMMVMGTWIADSLVVWDDRLRRVSVISPDVTFARSFRLTLPEGLPFARVLGVYPDGSFMGMSFTNMGQAPEPGLQRAPIRLHHFGSDGNHIGVAGEAPGTEVFYTVDGSGQVGLYPPHFFRGGNHLASDRLLVAPNDSWELTFRSPDGEAEQIVRWLKAPEPVTAEATAASLDRLIERIPEPGQAAARAVADDLDGHATMPGFDRVFYDRLGRVWVQAYDPTEAAVTEWTVVGTDGDLIATTSLPRSLLFRDAGPDWVLVRVLDELDVERLLLADIKAVRGTLRLFGKDREPDQEASAPEHAVLVYLKLSDDEYGSHDERAAIHLLSDRLEAAVNEAASGEFDGNEFGEGGCTLYMYGPDADQLWASVEATLRASPLTAGGHAIKRYGGPGAASRTERVVF